MQRACLTLIFMFFTALGGMFATAQPVDGGHARVELVSERQSVDPGETVFAALKMEMDSGWHVYWRNAGDAGLPPQLIVHEASDLPENAIGEFVWPIPHLLPVVDGEIMDYGYDDVLVLPFPITVPADATGPVELSVTADYLICEDVCIPESADVTLTLQTSGPVPNETNGALIADWIAKAPVTLEGEARIDATAEPWQLSLSKPGGFPDAVDIRFYPYGHEINHSAPQPLSRGDEGATLTLTPGYKLGETLDGIVIVETSDGERTGYAFSASRGDVLPNTSGQALVASAARLSLTGLLGFAFAAFLGGLVLNLMPCVLPVLSIKAMGMISAVSSGHAGEVRAHGIWYTSGVLISFALLAGALIAIRTVTGDANLGFQLQNGPTVAILALVMFAIGLWLFGMFELGTSIQNTGSTLAGREGSLGAFFTGVLAAIVGAPCVGPFLGVALGAVIDQPAPAVLVVFLAMGLGLAAPFLVLSFLPGLHRLLPKPGMWMETLKQFFAFPMFLTAAWLLWVLGDLAGSSAVAWALAGGVLLVFGIWLGKRGGRVRQVLAGLAILTGFAYPAVQANAAPGAAGTSSAYAAKYETEAWSPQRVSELTAEGRAVFIDFTATWCATCQLNKSTTLKTKAVQDAFAANNVAFLVGDFTRKDPMIAQELKLRQRAGVPMYLWYAPGETEPEILPEVLSQQLVIGLVEGR